MSLDWIHDEDFTNQFQESSSLFSFFYDEKSHADFILMSIQDSEIHRTLKFSIKLTLNRKESKSKVSSAKMIWAKMIRLLSRLWMSSQSRSRRKTGIMIQKLIYYPCSLCYWEWKHLEQVCAVLPGSVSREALILFSGMQTCGFW